jgi:hypothetical protein
MNPTAANLALDPVRLEKTRADRLLNLGGALASGGIALSALAGVVAPQRFAHAYLVAFTFTTTLCLGGLFFVIIQHLTRAGWSVTVRRQMEWLASFLPVCALLFLPVVLFRERLYHAWMSPEAAANEVLHQKAAFLNPGFFFFRAALYFAIWGLLSYVFVKGSRDQDESGDPALTRRMRSFSGPGTLLFALSVSFAGFDWLMSMQPLWYSTIFGVYVFSGAAVGGLAALALMLLAIQGSGILRVVSTIEHRHDVGKFLFGFTVFYAYISFSQYFLIWYANIPEETIFYAVRWVGSWRVASLVLVFAHFPVPFVLLLSRTGKRNPVILGAAAGILLFAHYLDLYWLVMPHVAPESAAPSWVDFAALAGPLGALLGFLAWRAARSPLYPSRDPMLREAVRLENA